MSESTSQLATFGGGCFWCTEAVFQNVRGVSAVVSGYCGGETKNPSYKEICTGTTGHAEVIQIEFDPNVVPFSDLLQVFFQTHDPTTLNRQGNDAGTQYRSVVFYHHEEQKQQTEAYIQQLNESGAFASPIVTQVVPATEFFPAEDYHQNYYQSNSNQSYCQYVILPKLEKFKKHFAHMSEVRR